MAYDDLQSACVALKRLLDDAAGPVASRLLYFEALVRCGQDVLPAKQTNPKRSSAKPFIEVLCKRCGNVGLNKEAETRSIAQPNSTSVSASHKNRQFAQDPLYMSSNGKADGRAYFISPPSKIVVCADRLYHPGEMETVLIHELQHALDNEVLGMDLSDPQHLACSEVRAAKFAEARFLSDRLWCFPTRERRSFSRQLATAATSTYAGDRAGPCVTEVFERCYSAQYDVNPLVQSPPNARDPGISGVRSTSLTGRSNPNAMKSTCTGVQVTGRVRHHDNLGPLRATNESGRASDAPSSSLASCAGAAPADPQAWPISPLPTPEAHAWNLHMDGKDASVPVGLAVAGLESNAGRR